MYDRELINGPMCNRKMDFTNYKLGDFTVAALNVKSSCALILTGIHWRCLWLHNDSHPQQKPPPHPPTDEQSSRAMWVKLPKDNNPLQHLSLFYQMTPRSARRVDYVSIIKTTVALVRGFVRIVMVRKCSTRTTTIIMQGFRAFMNSRCGRCKVAVHSDES